ncbi:hypothetical protein B0H11DRAFT_2254348 [Mycena galericulata]|nr:hypothetical protein B0H11DRAFT_2254348 [Mycena galericulata]
MHFLPLVAIAIPVAKFLQSIVVSRVSRSSAFSPQRLAVPTSAGGGLFTGSPSMFCENGKSYPYRKMNLHQQITELSSQVFFSPLKSESSVFMFGDSCFLSSCRVNERTVTSVVAAPVGPGPPFPLARLGSPAIRPYLPHSPPDGGSLSSPQSSPSMLGGQVLAGPPWLLTNPPETGVHPGLGALVKGGLTSNPFLCADLAA